MLAGAGNDGKGVAGVCWSCRVLAIKVLGADGSGNESDVSSGVVEATDRGAKVINMSLASPDDSPILDSAIVVPNAHGVIVFGAAGNDGVDTPMYPANSRAWCRWPGPTSPRARSGVELRQLGRRRRVVVQRRSGRRPAVQLLGTSSATPLVSGVAALAAVGGPEPHAGGDRVGARVDRRADQPGGVGGQRRGRRVGPLEFALAQAPLPPPPPPPPDLRPSASIEAPVGFLSGTATSWVDVAGRPRRVVGAAVRGRHRSSAAKGSMGMRAHVVIAWPTNWHPDGPVSLRALVTDSAGDQSWSASVGGRIDNNPPGVLIVGPHTGGRIATNYSVYLGAADTNGIVITLVAANGKIIGGAPGAASSGSPPTPGEAATSKSSRPRWTPPATSPSRTS